MHFSKLEVKESTVIESCLQRWGKAGREHNQFVFLFSEGEKMKELEELRKKKIDDETKSKKNENSKEWLILPTKGYDR